MSPVSLLLALLLGAPAAPSTQCTYRTYEWSTVKKKGVGHRVVEKLRSELKADEKAAAEPRCTVCSEDQVKISIEGLKPFRVCHVYAEQVKTALESLRQNPNFRLQTVVGYRVGRTRGAIDKKGRRTIFSNHSYGTAVDINSGTNGLYRRCRTKETPRSAADIAHCKKGMGGDWRPKRRPKQTITVDGLVHAAFSGFWKWGGALKGPLKDFMHFSPTGE